MVLARLVHAVQQAFPHDQIHISRKGDVEVFETYQTDQGERTDRLVVFWIDTQVALASMDVHLDPAPLVEIEMFVHRLHLNSGDQE